MTTDLEEQENEILALSSIFDSETFTSFKSNQKNVVRFAIDIDFQSKTLEIKLKEDASRSAEVSYLPPVYCTCILPPNYPSTSNPEVCLVASWLYLQLVEKVNDKLRAISAENSQSPVLFLFYQCIKDETFDLIDKPLILNLCKPAKIRLKPFPNTVNGSLREIVIPNNNNNTPILNNGCGSNVSNLPSPKQQKDHALSSEERLLQALVDFDQFQKRKTFEKSTVLCEICFSEQLGAECSTFQPCGHCFCRPCCRNFFELHIREGTFELMKCMANECQSQAHQQMIKSVVGEVMYERYERMTLTRSLDMMRDVVICPRPGCGAFVVTDDQYSRMAFCSVCLFAFCTLCKRVYHGVAACQLSSREANAIAEEYNAGDEEVKTRLEEKFGKLTMKRLVEDASSTKWLLENCSQCPSCRSPIQKRDGCNKMWCSHCGNYFCWLCLKSLSRDNPYKHFNDPDSECFNLLFRGVEEPDDDEGDSGSSDEDN